MRWGWMITKWVWDETTVYSIRHYNFCFWMKNLLIITLRVSFQVEITQPNTYIYFYFCIDDQCWCSLQLVLVNVEINQGYKSNKVLPLWISHIGWNRLWLFGEEDYITNLVVDFHSTLFIAVGTTIPHCFIFVLRIRNHKFVSSFLCALADYVLVIMFQFQFQFQFRRVIVYVEIIAFRVTFWFRFPLLFWLALQF